MKIVLKCPIASHPQYLNLVLLPYIQPNALDADSLASLFIVSRTSQTQKHGMLGLGPLFGFLAALEAVAVGVDGEQFLELLTGFDFGQCSPFLLHFVYILYRE